MRGVRFKLRDLASRIRHGDRAAAAEFKVEFERHLARMIRRLIRSGRATSEVDRHIAAAIGGMRGNDWWPVTSNSAGLTDAVCQQLCRATLATIQSGGHLKETVIEF